MFPDSPIAIIWPPNSIPLAALPAVELAGLEQDTVETISARIARYIAPIQRYDASLAVLKPLDT
jgi:hypothetical protein